MIEVRETDVFKTWIRGLKDVRGRAKINGRITRLSLGNPGDVEPVGDGVSELKIDFGPGYRVYYKPVGNVVVIVLCGGDKSTQAKDIKTALEIAKEFK